MRPPVHMPEPAMMIEGTLQSLMRFDSSRVAHSLSSGDLRRYIEATKTTRLLQVAQPLLAFATASFRHGIAETRFGSSVRKRACARLHRAALDRFAYDRRNEFRIA